jgi:hypothetical protein
MTVVPPRSTSATLDEMRMRKFDLPGACAAMQAAQQQ